MADPPKALQSSGTIRIPVAGGQAGAHGRQRRRVESRLASLDTDGDGVIDRQELVMGS